MHAGETQIEELQEHYRPPEAAAYLKISESQLSKLRMKQNRVRGPRFANVAGCILYRRVDLDDWVKSKIISV
ncbi:hypothetical protein [uncultured Litoreibacter sp.]|uniref:hypothetical protein n=1 Tax=uncultured Litoreibacter sp. TaxID=1392394 RepID=UPI002623A952|nr:hypothetical protein [uncultured Litoreibacter sp.]